GVAPFWAAIYMLVLSDLPPIFVGTPILIAVLTPLLEKRGLLKTRW
ncbi:MAG: histidine kinase, partial [Thermoprotei archaeon]